MFFEESIEGTINIIHRPSFEARLRAHFDVEEKIEADPAWYALRNMVYAFGSRLSATDSPANSWIEAQLLGWQYFQNALSVHSDLIYSCSSILAVRALFCMVSFPTSLYSPSNTLHYRHSTWKALDPRNLSTCLLAILYVLLKQKDSTPYLQHRGNFQTASFKVETCFSGSFTCMRNRFLFVQGDHR